MAVRSVAASLTGVPAIPVLDDGDVSRHVLDLAVKMATVATPYEISEAMQHTP